MAAPHQDHLDDSKTLVVTLRTPPCLYRGRPCYEPRDLKLNGRLHRYCRTHRLRHNQYQRESQQRRRAEQRAAQREQAEQELAQVEVTDAWLDSFAHLFPEDEAIAMNDDAFTTSLHDVFVQESTQPRMAFTMDQVLMETGSIDDLLAFLPSVFDT